MLQGRTGTNTGKLYQMQVCRMACIYLAGVVHLLYMIWRYGNGEKASRKFVCARLHHKGIVPADEKEGLP